MSMSSAETCKISNRTHLLAERCAFCPWHSVPGTFFEDDAIVPFQLEIWRIKVIDKPRKYDRCCWKSVTGSVSAHTIDQRVPSSQIASLVLLKSRTLLFGLYTVHITTWSLENDVVFTTFLVFKFVLFWKWTWPRVWSIRRFCPCIDCRYLCLFSTLFLDCVVTSFHFFLFCSLWSLMRSLYQIWVWLSAVPKTSTIASR